MSATFRSRPAVRRARAWLLTLLTALPVLSVAACGGGGGGGGPPGLQAGADVNGEWSVEVTPVSTTGSCTASASTDPMTAEHVPATGFFSLGGFLDGRMTGVEVALNGSFTDTGETFDYNGKLTFAVDATSFSGTITMTNRTAGCSATGSVRGVRAAKYDLLPSGVPLEFDDPLVLTFDRPIDASTVAANSIAVQASRRTLAGTTSLIAPNVLQFVADEMFPVDVDVLVRVSDAVRAADGRACSTAVVTRHTLAFSEFFRFRLESPDGQVALDTTAAGEVVLSAPANTSGQRWRFNRIGYGEGTNTYRLRNDFFRSDRLLSGGDGTADATMGSSLVLVDAKKWFAPTLADGFRLRSQSSPVSALVRTTALPGGSVRVLDGSDPQGEWLLRPIERIADGVPSVAMNVGEIIQASLTNTDPTGLRDVDRFINLYSFELPFQATVTITLRSSDMDSWLMLLSDDTFDDTSLVAWRQSLFAEDDDNGGADLEALSPRDSRLQLAMAPGRYFVAATTFGANDTGNYRLQATAVESSGTAPLTLTPVPVGSMPATKKR